MKSFSLLSVSKKCEGTYRHRVLNDFLDVKIDSNTNSEETKYPESTDLVLLKPPCDVIGDGARIVNNRKMGILQKVFRFPS